MKRLVMVWAVIVVGSSGWDKPSCAACSVRVAAAQAEVAVVPVAVSVGIPVAPAVPYYYSYSQFAMTQQVDVEAIASRVVEKLQARVPGPVSNASAAKDPSPADRASTLSVGGTAPSLVASKCVRCHGGSNPKHGLSLENLSTLGCEIRLKAVRAVLAEKMPQGGPPLTPEECGKVLEELVGSEK